MVHLHVHLNLVVRCHLRYQLRLKVFFFSQLMHVDLMIVEKCTLTHSYINKNTKYYKRLLLFLIIMKHFQQNYLSPIPCVVQDYDLQAVVGIW